MLSSNFPLSVAPLNVLDSGCSIHIISRKQKCISKSQIEPVAVATASESVLQLKESGNARICIKDGRGNSSTALLNNALISPTLDFNLVSVSQLDKAGCIVQFGNGQAIIKKDGIETARGLLNKAGLYTLISSSLSHASTPPSSICLSSPIQQDTDKLASSSDPTASDPNSISLDYVNLDSTDGPGHGQGQGAISTNYFSNFDTISAGDVNSSFTTPHSRQVLSSRLSGGSNVVSSVRSTDMFAGKRPTSRWQVAGDLPCAHIHHLLIFLLMLLQRANRVRKRC